MAHPTTKHGDGFDPLQNAWRLRYVIATHFPERMDAVAGEHTESAQVLASMSCGEVYTASARYTTMLRKFSLASVISATKFLTSPPPDAGDGDGFPYMDGVGNAHLRKLVARRTPQLLSAHSSITQSTFHETTSGSYFAVLKGRIQALAADRAALHTEMLHYVRAGKNAEEQGTRLGDFAVQPKMQELHARIFDICELLLVGGLLMIEVVDGTNKEISERFGAQFDSTSTGWYARYEKVTRAHSTALDHLKTLLGVVLGRPGAGTRGIGVRDIAFRNGNKVGNAERVNEILDRCCETFMQNRRRAFMLCVPAKDGRQVYFDATNARGVARFMMPIDAFYSEQRDNPTALVYDKASRAWTRKSKGGDVQRLMEMGIAPPKEEGAISAAIRFGSAPATNVDADACNDACRTAVELSGLPNGGDLCTQMCDSNSPRRCLASRYEQARDDPALKTEIERRQLLASLLLNYTADVGKGCGEDANEATSKELCEARVKRACDNIECNTSGVTLDHEEFAGRVCDPYGDIWHKFATPAITRAEMTRDSGVAKKDAERLRQLSKDMNKNLTCNDALTTSARCKATPLRCFIAALDTDRKLQQALPENEYGIVRTACATEMRPLRENNNRTITDDAMRAAVSNPCTLLLTLKQGQVNMQSVAGRILQKLSEDGCKDMLELDMQNINSRTLGDMHGQLQPMYDKGIAALGPGSAGSGSAGTSKDPFPPNLTVTARQYRDLMTLATTRFDTVIRSGMEATGTNPINLLFNAFDLSYMDMYKYKAAHSAAHSDTSSLSLTENMWGADRPIFDYLQKVNVSGSGHSWRSSALEQAVALGYVEIATRVTIEAVREGGGYDVAGEDSTAQSLMHYLGEALDQPWMDTGDTRKRAIMKTSITPKALSMALKALNSQAGASGTQASTSAVGESDVHRRKIRLVATLMRTMLDLEFNEIKKDKLVASLVHHLPWTKSGAAAGTARSPFRPTPSSWAGGDSAAPQLQQDEAEALTGPWKVLDSRAEKFQAMVSLPEQQNLGESSVIGKVLRIVGDIANDNANARSGGGRASGSNAVVDWDFWRAHTLACICSVDFFDESMQRARTSLLSHSTDYASAEPKVCQWYLALLCLQLCPNTERYQHEFMSKIHQYGERTYFQPWREAIWRQHMDITGASGDQPSRSTGFSEPKSTLDVAYSKAKEAHAYANQRSGTDQTLSEMFVSSQSPIVASERDEENQRWIGTQIARIGKNDNENTKHVFALLKKRQIVAEAVSADGDGVQAENAEDQKIMSRVLEKAKGWFGTAANWIGLPYRYRSSSVLADMDSWETMVKVLQSWGEEIQVFRDDENGLDSHFEGIKNNMTARQIRDAMHEWYDNATNWKSANEGGKPSQPSRDQWNAFMVLWGEVSEYDRDRSIPSRQLHERYEKALLNTVYMDMRPHQNTYLVQPSRDGSKKRYRLGGKQLEQVNATLDTMRFPKVQDVDRTQDGKAYAYPERSCWPDASSGEHGASDAIYADMPPRGVPVAAFRNYLLFTTSRVVDVAEGDECWSGIMLSQHAKTNAYTEESLARFVSIGGPHISFRALGRGIVRRGGDGMQDLADEVGFALRMLTNQMLATAACRIETHCIEDKFQKLRSVGMDRVMGRLMGRLFCATTFVSNGAGSVRVRKTTDNHAVDLALHLLNDHLGLTTSADRAQNDPDIPFVQLVQLPNESRALLSHAVPPAVPARDEQISPAALELLGGYVLPRSSAE